jgi:hypothetical protein
MRWLLFILVALASLVLVMAVIGAVLPRKHEATRAANFRQRPAALYGLIRDFAPAAPWRRDAVRVELLPARDGRPTFREVSGRHAITYVVLQDRPAERLVMKIADEDLPYGGTWTYEFIPTAEGTSVRITERGEIKNVWFRFLARFAFGYTGSMDTRLRDIGRHFGEPATIY